MSAREGGVTAYRVFRTALGWCAAARNAEGVCAFVLPCAARDAAEEIIRARFRVARPSARGLPTLVQAAARYFDGWRTDFSAFRLDLSTGTPFQQRVWQIAARIPYGQVRTYRWIALEMGRPEACQAIGSALGANPVPLLIPCHRVVAAGGEVGGFSAEGGVALKVKMLQLERVRLAQAGEGYRVLA